MAVRSPSRTSNPEASRNVNSWSAARTIRIRPCRSAFLASASARIARRPKRSLSAAPRCGEPEVIQTRGRERLACACVAVIARPLAATTQAAAAVVARPGAGLRRGPGPSYSWLGGHLAGAPNPALVLELDAELLVRPVPRLGHQRDRVGSPRATGVLDGVRVPRGDLSAAAP